MPSQYTRRPAPCSTCGDVVLIAAKTPNKRFGKAVERPPVITLEHADPGPDGEVFDAVDDGCRRARVR